VVAVKEAPLRVIYGLERKAQRLRDRIAETQQRAKSLADDESYLRELEGSIELLSALPDGEEE
jgi:hypothetical protein